MCSQLCPTLCDHMDCSPPGSSVSQGYPGKNTGVDYHFLFQGIFLTQAMNPSLLHLLPLQGDSLASLVAQLVKNLPAMQKTWVWSLGWEDPLERKKGYPLQYSGLENSMDCIMHGVAKTQKQLSNFHFTSLPLGHLGSPNILFQFSSVQSLSCV